MKKPYPYESWKSIPLLEECLRTTPPCPEHNLLRLQLGKLLMEARKPEDAARQTQAVLQAKPSAEITKIAKALLKAIYAPEIEWFKPTSKNSDYEYNREVMLTNTKNSVWVRSRNAPSLQCALYRIPMEKWVDKSENSQNWKNPWYVQNMFQENGQREGSPEQALVREGATLLKRWSLPVKSHSIQAPAETEITLPTQEGGYYVLVASNGTKRTAHVLHITGRVLIASSNGNSYYAYVTDAKSGKPLANQPVFVSGFLENTEGVVVKKLQKLFTNREGLCRWTGDSSSFRTCWTVSGRDITYSSFNEYVREAEADIQLFGVTDRKIYRPGQTVYYRLVVTKPQGRACRPIAGRAVEVVVTNPKNEEIAHTAAVTNEFGSVHGEIPLPNRAALGGYTITLKEGVRSRYGQGVGFQVEEYKKPEFEVKVTTEPERVALGKKGTFKVKVSYYAGGGVPNAKIAYQMTLQDPYYGYSRGMSFDWTAGRYSSRANASQNGILEQGVLYTNAHGEATLPFDTAVLLKNRDAQVERWGSSITLTVQAQDSSRRVIEGSGTVNVDRSEGSAFTDLSQRYGRIGSPLEITIHATANDESPLAVTGQAVIQRVQDRRRTTVYQQAVRIGKEGTTTLRWTPVRGGKYEIQFKAEGGRRIESSPDTLLVVGAGLEESDLDRDVSLVAERYEYDTEHSARLLLTTPTKDCWALFFQATQGGGQTTQVLHLQGRVQELEIPINPEKAGFEIKVLVIRDGRKYDSSETISFSNRRSKAVVTVESDKADYAPGGQAHLKVKVRDYNGKPLRTELSIAVSDASLDYFTGTSRNQHRYFARDDDSEWGDFTPVQENSISYQSSLDSSSDTYYSNGNEGLFSFNELPSQAGQSILSWLESEQGRISNFRSNFRRRGFSSGGGGGFGGDGRPGIPMLRVLQRGTLGNGNVGSTQAIETDPGINRVSTGYVDSTLPIETVSGINRGSKGKSQSQFSSAYLRKKFADTALWIPTLVTDAEGSAEATVTLPENLTRWQVKTAGNTVDGVAGSGSASIVTQKRLQVRLQAPRFLIEKDTVVLSAIVQNKYDQNLSTKVQLELEGAQPELVANLLPNASRMPSIEITVPANGEKRVDWAVLVKAPGNLKVRMTALTSVESDATELTLPVLVHGVEKAQAKSGFLSGKSEVKIPITLPTLRKAGSSRVVVHLAPSLIGVMLDTLPYLADYPYGCVEQTMSRFLPSVIVSKTLKDMGYQLGDLQKRADALAKREREAPENTSSPYTYPQTTLTHLPPLTHRYGWSNPVFQESRLKEMIQDGWARLKEMEYREGGWGWWAGDKPDPYMTSYVLYGLRLAKKAEVKIPEELLSKGVQYLQNHFAEEKDLNRAAFEARVLAMEGGVDGNVGTRIVETLYPSRDKMSLYGRALLALALHKIPQPEKARTVLVEIERLLQAEAKQGRLIAQPKEYWYWYHNETETLATILQAYVEIKPKAPMAVRIVEELIRTRQNHVWESTRDTALVVLAMADYVRANRELQTAFTVQVSLGGKAVQTYNVTPENALMTEGQIVLGEEYLRKGVQNLTLSKSGEGNCYYTVETRYVAEEETLRAVRGEVQVERRYYRLLPNPDYKPLREEPDNPLLAESLPRLELQDDWSLRSEVKQTPYLRTLLLEDSRLESGDTVEVELYLNSRNPQAYMLFEDIKPAGCEAVQLESGRGWGSSDEAGYSFWGGWLSYYQEVRDQKVAFFFEELPQGKSLIKYQLRAETPGVFRVLPTNGYAMYSPNIRALSEEATTHISEVK